MTPQIKLVLIGAAVAAVARFYYQKDNQTAALYGATAISVVAILTAHKDKPES